MLKPRKLHRAELSHRSNERADLHGLAGENFVPAQLCAGAGVSLTRSLPGFPGRVGGTAIGQVKQSRRMRPEEY